MKSIVFISGKGGVGKSVIATNLACALAENEKSVLLYDADLGLAGQDVLCGVEIGCTLGHVVRDKRDCKDAVHTSRYGFEVVSGGSGWSELSELSTDQRSGLHDSVWAEAAGKEYLLVDGQSGCSVEVVALASRADQVIAVCGTESTSLLGAYAAVKLLAEKGFSGDIGLVVNEVENSAQGHQIAQQFQTVVGQFLSVSVVYLGSVRKDNAMAQSVFERKPVVAGHPKSRCAQDFAALSERICGEAESAEGGELSLLEKLKSNFSRSQESEDQAA